MVFLLFFFLIFGWLENGRIHDTGADMNEHGGCRYSGWEGNEKKAVRWCGWVGAWDTTMMK